VSTQSYAVIASGGRQLRVEAGQTVRVDRLNVTPEQGVTFDRVLLVGNGDDVRIGTPQVEGASVRGTVVREQRDRKIIVFKKKRRKGYKKTRGHRQYFTLVHIDSIDG